MRPPASGHSDASVVPCAIGRGDRIDAIEGCIGLAHEVEERGERGQGLGAGLAFLAAAVGDAAGAAGDGMGADLDGPGQVKDVFKIPFDRPRTLSLKRDPRFPLSIPLRLSSGLPSTPFDGRSARP